MLGKVIYQTQLLNSESEINIAHFQSGMYLTEINVGDKTIIKKLIKK